MNPIDPRSRQARLAGRRRTAVVTLAVGGVGVVAATGLTFGFAHQQAVADGASAAQDTTAQDPTANDAGTPTPAAVTPSASAPRASATPSPSRTSAKKKKAKSVAPQPVYTPPRQAPAPAPATRQPNASSGGS